MNDTVIEYPPGPASLFATAAREVKILWTWCIFCRTQTDQMYDHDDKIYRCCICGTMNKKAVKP